MKISAAGIQFRNIVSGVSIGDNVVLVAEPENKHNKDAIAIYGNNDLLIGYIPSAKTEKGKQISNRNKLPGKLGKVLDIKWVDEDGTFNNVGIGKIGYVLVDIDTKEIIENNGKEYERITSFLSRTKKLYENEESVKILQDWNERNEDGLAMSARLGTIIHNLVEDLAKVGAGCIGDYMKKNNLKFVKSEERIFDEGLKLTGKYDLMFCKTGDENYLVMVDVKSSKQTQLSHKLQVSFYAKNKNCKEAIIFRPNDNTVQKYSISVVNIDDNYNKLKEIILLDNNNNK